MPNMKEQKRSTEGCSKRLISKNKKVTANVKVFLTDRQTDGIVITIGHPPSGGTINIALRER